MHSKMIKNLITTILPTLEIGKDLDSATELLSFRDTSIEVISGSTAYGVSGNASDIDIISVVVPPIEYLYPHLDGYVEGFFKPEKSFDLYTKHGIIQGDSKYDVTVYSLQKFFELAYDNNPNILELLWIEPNCILGLDAVGNYLFANRTNFLSKKSYHKLKGYCMSQFDRIKRSNRDTLIAQHGFDTKNAYHAIRLIKQCEGVLLHGDMQLTKHAQLYSDIRGGKYTYSEMEEMFNQGLAAVDAAALVTQLPEEMDIRLAKAMLKDCIKLTYG